MLLKCQTRIFPRGRLMDAGWKPGQEVRLTFCNSEPGYPDPSSLPFVRYEEPCHAADLSCAYHAVMVGERPLIQITFAHPDWDLNQHAMLAACADVPGERYTETLNKRAIKRKVLWRGTKIYPTACFISRLMLERAEVFLRTTIKPGRYPATLEFLQPLIDPVLFVWTTHLNPEPVPEPSASASDTPSAPVPTTPESPTSSSPSSNASPSFQGLPDQRFENLPDLTIRAPQS